MEAQVSLMTVSDEQGVPECHENHSEYCRMLFPHFLRELHPRFSNVRQTAQFEISTGL
jgi:hypothetical protein